MVYRRIIFIVIAQDIKTVLTMVYSLQPDELMAFVNLQMTGDYS